MNTDIIWPADATADSRTPSHLLALIGQSVESIDTPALVIDLDAMERNLARMARFAREKGLRLRPHAKMHKSARLARLQMAAGAVGVCVQKTEEAELLAEAGVTDIYISNQVVAPVKLARVAALSRRMARAGGQLALAVDSITGVDNLSNELDASDPPIHVFVELDVGHGRCGVAPGEATLALVQRVLSCKSMQFAGLQAYHGRVQHVRSWQQRQDIVRKVVQTIGDTIGSLKSLGIEVPLVTGAGTGCFAYEGASGVYGELQVGSYLFMDADYARNESDPEVPQFEHALFVKTQIMSRGSAHSVCDAGHKSHAIDSGMPTVYRRPDLEYKVGGDEHGIIVGQGEAQQLPGLAEVLWLVPGHCDPTVNLHSHLIGLRGARPGELSSGRVERIIAVDARGALR